MAIKASSNSILFLLIMICCPSFLIHAQDKDWNEFECLHCEPVNAIAWSPDGKAFALANDSGLWIYDEQFRLVSWLSHSRTTKVAWSYNGLWLASVEGEVTNTSQLSHLNLWSTSKKQLIATLVSPTLNLIDISWSSKQNLLAYTHNTSVDLWDADKGMIKEVIRIPSEMPTLGLKEWGYVWWVTWSPTGEKIAIATGSMDLYIWDVNSKLITQQSTGTWDAVGRGVWDAQGERLAIPAYAAADMPNLFQIKTDTISRLQLHADNGDWFPSLLAWSPDNKLLAADKAGTGWVSLWDTSNWHQVSIFRNLQVPVTAFAWANDSKKLAVAYSNGTVHIWARPDAQP